MPKRRPNILLITTDQHRADCYSFARRDIKTPHLDALAARGTRFERCYCPGPLCQPARASILTGMLPLTHGVRDNGIDLPDDMIGRGFAQQLADQGYRTSLMGKAHLSTQFTFEATGRPECRKSMHKFYDDWFGPYMGFDHLELFIDGPVKWPDWEPPEGLLLPSGCSRTGAARKNTRCITAVSGRAAGRSKRMFPIFPWLAIHRVGSVTAPPILLPGTTVKMTSRSCFGFHSRTRIMSLMRPTPTGGCTIRTR